MSNDLTRATDNRTQQRQTDSLNGSVGSQQYPSVNQEHHPLQNNSVAEIFREMSKTKKLRFERNVSQVSLFVADLSAQKPKTTQPCRSPAPSRANAPQNSLVSVTRLATATMTGLLVSVN